MAEIEVTIEEIEIDSARGYITGLAVCCELCNNIVEVYGTGPASIKRGCAMLREQCDGKNFYFYDGDL
ncbi:hypothetical protein ABIF78_007685 [Bradyrhizobium japonicum]|jgi:hypothetical protein